MEKESLHTTDKKMIEVIKLLKQSNLISYQKEFYECVGINRQNIRNITLGTQHFTVSHIQKACIAYGINANWIFGFEDNIFRKKQ